MKRVTGIGGIFFKADQPEALRAWYQEHLGIPNEHMAPRSRGATTRTPTAAG